MTFSLPWMTPEFLAKQLQDAIDCIDRNTALIDKVNASIVPGTTSIPIIRVVKKEPKRVSKTNWYVGDLVETRSGLWEISFIGTTTYVLRNDSGRLHVLFENEMDEYCTKVDV